VVLELGHDGDTGGELARLLRKERRGTVKIVKQVTVQLVLELTPAEVEELREWLHDHELLGNKGRYVEGSGTPLPGTLVGLLETVTS
jgi:hypothetical protein